jgi:hypothetical protein
MIDCDLSLERSTVNATVLGDILSVKNPLEGRISADRIGEIIDEYGVCEITERNLENASY